VKGLIIDFCLVLTGLRSLRLSFESLIKGRKSISAFVKAIFGEKGITDRGVGKFGANLAGECEYLELVSLEFEKYAKISDRGVESLCEGLKIFFRV